MSAESKGPGQQRMSLIDNVGMISVPNSLEEMELLFNTIGTLKRVKEKLERETQWVRSLQEQLAAEKNKNNETLAQSNQRTRALQDQIEQLRAELKTRQTKEEDLQKRIVAAQEMIAEIRNAQALERQKAESAAIRAQVSLEEENRNKIRVEAELQRLTKQLYTEQLQAKAVTETLNRYRTEWDKMIRHDQGMRQALADNQEQLIKAMEQADTYKSQSIELGHQAKELSRRLESAQEEFISTQEQSQTKIEALRQEVERFSRDKTELLAELEEARVELEDLRAQNAKKIAELSAELEKTREEAEHRINVDENTHRYSKKALNREIEKLKATLKLSAEETNTARCELEAAKQEIVVLKRSLEKENEKAETATRPVALLTRQLRDSQKALAQIGASEIEAKSKLGQMVEELGRVKREREELEDQRTLLRDEIGKLTREYPVSDLIKYKESEIERIRSELAQIPSEISEDHPERQKRNALIAMMSLQRDCLMKMKKDVEDIKPDLGCLN